MDKRIILSATIILFALLIFGCTQTQTQNQATPNTQTQTIQNNGQPDYNPNSAPQINDINSDANTNKDILPAQTDTNNQGVLNPADTNTPAEAAPPQQVAVSIQNFEFSPNTITVKVGTTVTWTNNDSAQHTVTGGALDSPTLNQGQTYSHTFTQAGTSDYICIFHQSMRGKVIVE